MADHIDALRDLKYMIASAGGRKDKVSRMVALDAAMFALAQQARSVDIPYLATPMRDDNEGERFRYEYEKGWNDCRAMFIASPNNAALAQQAGAVDRNVESVRTKMLERSAVGLAKYGVTTERGDLSHADWLKHLQEELMDAAVYIEAAIASSGLGGGGEVQPLPCSCGHDFVECFGSGREWFVGCKPCSKRDGGREHAKGVTRDEAVRKWNESLSPKEQA